VKRLAFLACAALIGCASSQTDTRANLPMRPAGEDPLALLPSGADLIADVDMEQLRRWGPTRRFLRLLPDDAQMRLERLGFDPLAQVEALYVTVAGLGTARPSSVVLVRGEIDLEKAKNALGPPSEVAEGEYRGVYVVEGPDGALARVLPKMLVFASRADVRRVIDRARGEGESLLDAAGDRVLMRAFSRAPTAKQGRPAVVLSVIPPPDLRDRIKKEQLPGHEIQWLALSFAVGDGFDVGGVAGVTGPAEAEALVEAARAKLSEFSSRTAVRLLGLKPFLDPVRFKAREDEVHFAYRLPAPTVEQMLSGLETVRELARKEVGR
jgi:hypothetical protein